MSIPPLETFPTFFPSKRPTVHTAGPARRPLWNQRLPPRKWTRTTLKRKELQGSPGTGSQRQVSVGTGTTSSRSAPHALFFVCIFVSKCVYSLGHKVRTGTEHWDEAALKTVATTYKFRLSSKTSLDPTVLFCMVYTLCSRSS